MECDLLIVGAGPAGLTAAIYGARAGLVVKILERGVPGGQLLNTDWIENYPGFPGGIGGAELMGHFSAQALSFEAVALVPDRVVGLRREDGRIRVEAEKETWRAGACIVASGAVPRTLGVPGEREFTGSGVSYCATCDGAFFRDRHVLVVGGGDTALEEAVFLTRFASRVTLVHRRGAFRGARILQERVQANGKIEVLYHRVLEEIRGEDGIREVVLADPRSHQTSALAVGGVFIFVGTRPNTGFLADSGVELDERGQVRAGDDLETSLPGVFAAGDVRVKGLRQVSTAVGDGALAAMSAYRYLEEHP